MNPGPGTYILILRNRRKVSIPMGRSGRVTIDVGYYLYVGSAFGPGGVKARVSRHLRKDKPRHWHIDYLREVVTPVDVWYTCDRRRFEHRWARLLSGMNGMSIVSGFGSSDCRCPSHLFYTTSEPDFIRFRDLSGVKLEARSVQTDGSFRFDPGSVSHPAG